MDNSKQSFVLTLTCPDGVGLVAAVTTELARHGASITEAHHYREPLSSSTILRIVFESGGHDALDITQFAQDFAAIARRFGMQWTVFDAATRLRVLVAVSKQGHCLNSLLHRWSTGTLPIEIVGVVSNHETHRRLTQWYGLPFDHLPIVAGRKVQQEQRLLELFAQREAELLILARYMQVLTDTACRQLAGRAINIHHSFLPGFKGADPYGQAFARGVKLIGATAHYINADLDEGPIIEQAVERVDHTMTVAQLTTLGHDIEAVVLNRAVQWHAEHRVFVSGNRTVVLR